MSKKAPSYEKTYYAHEKVMHNLLSCSATLLEFLREEHDTGHPRVIISQHDQALFYNIQLFEKILKESYNFNQFKALRRLLVLLCKDNLKYSTVMINICLKSFGGYQDSSIVGFLEATKELLLIDDVYSLERRQLILGVPTIMVDREMHNKKLKFGLRAKNNLEKQMYE